MENNCEVKQRPKTLKSLLKSWYFWKPASAAILGGVGGFLYYHFVGCSSEQCAITSNPFMSILFGSVLGLFITNSPCASGKC